MTKNAKLITKFKTSSRFDWVDLVALLKSLGFKLEEGAGSRVRFVKGNLRINMHKPHPQKEVKTYAVKQVKELLTSEGLI